MNKDDLVREIKQKQSFLCVGLDSDLTKIPKHLLSYDDPVLEFNKQIIDATKEYCVAYKPNIAFYECMGSKGWETLQKTLDYIPKNIFTIADAKRGDIGNTSACYAQSIFEHYNFDAITIAPYMGTDSIMPFIENSENGAYLLCLTSNPSALDFQYNDSNGLTLYENVAKLASKLNNDNLGLVVGATKNEQMQQIRDVAPKLNWLIPGIGKQGGDLESSVRISNFGQGSGLINVSRSIIYAKNQDLDDIRESTIEYNKNINKFIN